MSAIPGDRRVGLASCNVGENFRTSEDHAGRQIRSKDSLPRSIDKSKRQLTRAGQAIVFGIMFFFRGNRPNHGAETADELPLLPPSPLFLESRHHDRFVKFPQSRSPSSRHFDRMRRDHPHGRRTGHGARPRKLEIL
jgi:hypothetical protein